jgi:hypothetical protein
MTAISSVGAFAAGGPDEPVGAATGVLAGQFVQNGKIPLAGGRLFVYDKALGPPSSDRYVRVPDQIGSLDEEGRFSLELPAGTYYVSAMKMPEGGLMGPPADGELIYFKMDPQGNIQPFRVNAGATTDAGVVSTSVAYVRNRVSPGKGMTLVEGTVTDADGAPVEGALILAYVTPGIQDKAFYVSDRTAKEGKFVLRVGDGGTFYLRVRGEYGGTPREGEIVNIKEPSELVAVTVKKGERLTGVKIQIKRLQRGPLYEGK